MMKFLTFVGHRHGVHDLTVGRRSRLDVDDGESIGLEKFGLSSNVEAKFSGGASIASLGDA
jgi:hypothetical protein